MSTTEIEPVYSEGLAEELRLGGRRGRYRVIAIPKEGHSEDKLRGLLSETQMLTGRTPAPGLYELDVTLAQLDGLAAHDDVFRWFDLASRLYGEPITSSAGTATLKLYTKDADRARKAMQKVGGRVAGLSAEGVMLGTAPAAKLAALLMAEGIEAIEVTGTA